MTRSAGRAVDSNARASSKLIRVPPRLVAPAGCTCRDKANSQLRFCDVRRSTMLALARKFQRLDCGTSSHATSDRCNARLLDPRNIEQQLRARIFRFRVFGPTSCPRARKIARDRAARTQLQYVPSRRLPSPGRVARLGVAHNGGCELRPSPRFSWAKVWRSIDGNIANVCRECSRADSNRARSSRRMIGSTEDVERWLCMSRGQVSNFSTLLQHRLIWSASLFQDMSSNCDFVNHRLRPKWARGPICIMQVPRSPQLEIET